MPAGQTPHTVFVFAHNDLVDKVQPGDRVTVTGIYRAVSLRVNPIQSNVKSVYRTHIDVVHYRKIDVHRLRNQTERGYLFINILCNMYLLSLIIVYFILGKKRVFLLNAKHYFTNFPRNQIFMNVWLEPSLHPFTRMKISKKEFSFNSSVAPKKISRKLVVEVFAQK